MATDIRAIVTSTVPRQSPIQLQWREKSVISRRGRLDCAAQAGVAALRNLQSAHAHLCPRDALGRRQELLRLREELIEVGVAARAGNRRFQYGKTWTSNLLQ